MELRPIEKDFPIEQVNEIAEREAHAKEKYRPVNYIHKWWARRLGCVFRTIVIYTLTDENTKVFDEVKGEWRQITQEELENPWLLYLKDVDLGGKIVLEPMMGGGTTVVETLRTGCKVVAQDLNPVAWFLVKKIVEPVKIEDLQNAFDALENKIADEIKKYHRSICPHCLEAYAKIQNKTEEDVIQEVVEKLRYASDPRDVYEQYWFEDESKIAGKRNIFADAMYYFWIKEVPCLACGTEVPLFRGYMLARSRDKRGYHVICPECGNIFIVKDYKSDNTCQNCGKKFNPDEDGNVDGKYYVCTNHDCGQKNVIVETIQKTGKPKEKLYAVEYYCPHCGKKDYKKADEIDVALFERAKKEFKSAEIKWLGKYIPDTKIPKGQETYPRLIENHGYKYWKDMFNERQLLNLGKLLKEILNLDIDENVKEFLICTFSDTLNYQNMLCDYNRPANKLKELFCKHAFHPVPNPVENNIWGCRYGLGTFEHIFNKILFGKQYNIKAFEKYVKKGKTLEKPMNMKIIGKIGNIFGDDANAMIMCGDSSYINIPDKSVDAVITDPPYYGNVMYSELSEFYYAWLRLALKDKYEYFRSEHVPNATEAVVNKVLGKTEDNFVDSLTAIFKEAGRKLKDDGLMVFTFHHQDERAWGAVLQSVLNASFYISAIYPVMSESEVNPHIHNKANVRYDMIVVCKKRKDKAEKKYWEQIEDEIYFRVEEEIKRLEAKKRNLSQEDIFVITIGKCLELYSKHYPEVYKNGKKISVDEALASIREIVDSQLMHTRFNQVAAETDVITAVYLFYLAGKKSISYDALSKILSMRNIPMKEVLESRLIEKDGSQLIVLTPKERAESVGQKKDLSAVDRAHYLYYLWKEGKILEFGGSLGDNEKAIWTSEPTILTLKYLYEIENDKTYEDIIEFINGRWLKQKTLRG